jgi:hypothetical protein
VLGWIASADELEAWASRRDFPPRSEVFGEWHMDAEVHPYVVLVGDRLCGYGEVWEDRDEDEAELEYVWLRGAQSPAT